MEAQNNPRKSKRCSSCKKKKETVTSLPPVEEISIFPTNEEIEVAYANLTSFGGVKQEHKDQIQYVYQSLFNEELDFNCRSCVSTQVRKFTNYMVSNKLRI